MAEGRIVLSWERDSPDAETRRRRRRIEKKQDQATTKTIELPRGADMAVVRRVSRIERISPCVRGDDVAECRLEHRADVPYRGNPVRESLLAFAEDCGHDEGNVDGDSSSLAPETTDTPWQRKLTSAALR
ncbi:MAG: hypothetical protein ABI664_05655 [bacterium]